MYEVKQPLNNIKHLLQKLLFEDRVTGN